MTNMAPYGSNWVCLAYMAPFVYVGLYGSIWPHLVMKCLYGRYGSLRECMAYMAQYSSIWVCIACVAQYGSIYVCMANMALFECVCLIWLHMAPFGFVWLI